MTKFTPAGFNEKRILDGLHKAMGFAEPTQTDDVATFCFPKRGTVTEATDEDGVPFDPSVRPADASLAPKRVTCAVEYYDREGASTRVGEIKASRIKITLLSPEWQQVKDFSYVVAGGEKYLRGTLEPVVALGSIDVYTVWCTSEDES